MNARGPRLGLVDLTATLRHPHEPDEQHASALHDEARAGGFGVVVVSARVPQDKYGGHDVVDVEGLGSLQRALAAAGDDVRLVPALAGLRAGRDLADLASMAQRLGDDVPRVIRLRRPVDDALLLRRVGEMARALGALVIVPSVDAALSAGAVAVEGPVATRLGLPAVPEASEAIGVACVVEIARLTRARFHIAGLFTARGARLIELAAQDGVSVSGSVFPPHLLFDERVMLERRYDTRTLVRPPLPTQAAREALLDAVRRGALLVSSGHHPIPRREQDVEMTRASPGAATLGTAWSALTSVLPVEALERALGTGPAEVLGVAPPPRGPRADVVIPTAADEDEGLLGALAAHFTSEEAAR